MDTDKKVLGLTAASRERLARIESLEWFSDAQDIARFALALALREANEVGSVSDTDTSYGAGLFDSTGEIRMLIRSLFPDCATPVRFMEYLVDTGLQRMIQLLDRGVSSPYELMSAPPIEGKIA